MARCRNIWRRLFPVIIFVIISAGLWQRRFGANPGIVGSIIRLDGEGYVVIGVMPASFDFPDAETQVWTPVWRQFPLREQRNRVTHRFSAIGRLRPGVTQAQGGVELDGIARRIRQEYPN